MKQNNRFSQISEEEKKKILEQHQTPQNEQIIWDKGNMNAIKSYMNIGKPDRRFKITVEEPFTLETEDPDEFHKLKHILVKTRTKFTDHIEKI